MLPVRTEVKGPFPKKVLKNAQFRSQHFDDKFNFLQMEKDLVTQQQILRLVSFTKPVLDLKAELLSSSQNLSEEDKKKVILLHDFLDKCFTLNPQKRLKPEEALLHPFLQ